ncbi:MAG: hypothetical protein IKR48_05925 [Kiritimatiellae bacterium]|nr:hypothetical protein [Kiritimatiellia bacterium]
MNTRYVKESIDLTRKKSKVCEIVATALAANGYPYSYDSVGNSIHASRNAATNYYLSNELNQYSSILCASA